MFEEVEEGAGGGFEVGGCRRVPGKSASFVSLMIVCNSRSNCPVQSWPSCEVARGHPSKIFVSGSSRGLIASPPSVLGCEDVSCWLDVLSDSQVVDW